MAGAAVDSLKRLLTAKSEQVRLAAVTACFDLHNGMVSTGEILSRLEALEETQQ